MKQGFSLIELMIVIAIIGVLSTMMMPNFMNAQDKAKEASVKSVAIAIQSALESYYIDEGAYPAGRRQPIRTIAQTLQELGYLRRIPINPFTGEGYQSNDLAGRMEYDGQDGAYSLTGYKRDGATACIELSNG